MGKKQHQKDKMYLTYTEWSQFYGGKKTESLENEHIKFKRLPYDHCCITTVPFETPYCDLDGNVFELKAIFDFLKAFKVNPVTGKPQDAKSLIKLTFFKNHDDNYHCPALFKPFTKNSHIVAITTSGNVFSYEAVEQLNFKTKNWKDLVNDIPFTRKDVITIQDPTNIEKFNISTFYHIKKNIRVQSEEERLEQKDPKARLKSINMETRETLNELERDYKPAEETVHEHKVADKFNAAHYSTGAVAASFTSTAMAPVYTHEAAILDESEVKYERIKKKGYVRLLTNLGPLNFELFCNVVPKTCENFVKHCNNGYYNGLSFHRSIKNFMIQGGDPTGTGLGGKSIWGKKFEDEIKPQLSHTGRGILSMANSGPNTNGSQFFITYRSCRHLDGKHTIFGKLVGGSETLNDIEKINVDNKDAPIEPIIILKATVFVDPYQEVEEQLVADRKNEIERIKKEAQDKMKKKQNSQPLRVYREDVGKYFNVNAVKSEEKQLAGEPAAKKKNTANYSFGNFTSW